MYDKNPPENGGFVSDLNPDENFHRDSFKCVITIGLVFRRYVCVQKLKRHTAISRAPKNTDRLHHTIFHKT